jgi:virginiamycin B lyase
MQTSWIGLLGWKRLLLVGGMFGSAPAWCGGSNYGVEPGALPQFKAKVREWPVPAPSFAREPAVAPDGNVYLAIMQSNRIARFDPRTEAFVQWNLPEGTRPLGLLVGKNGHVYYTGSGNGTIGELDTSSGKLILHKLPSGGDPHTIVMDANGVMWLTVQTAGRVVRFDPATRAFREHEVGGRPHGIAIDRAGYIWFCKFAGDRLGRLNPADGNVNEVFTGEDSHPRRMAISVDGSLWVTLYGTNRLIQVDPQAMRIVKEYPLPNGSDGGAYAVTVDGNGVVWSNEITTDTVVRLEPKSGQLRALRLPSSNAGIRKMVVDAQGRLWYVGSHNGRLGVIE